MGDEDTRVLCPNCKSANWSVEHVFNTIDLKGLIQLQCNDCGQTFEVEPKTVSVGWTVVLPCMVWSDEDNDTGDKQQSQG